MSCDPDVLIRHKLFKKRHRQLLSPRNSFSRVRALLKYHYSFIAVNLYFAIDMLMNIKIASITLPDVPSFHLCLDIVAKERRFLALLEAPPLEEMRTFVSDNLARKVPQIVGKDNHRVIGWCDILPGWQHTLRHCGSLGMGILPEYRGQGLGRSLLEACLAIATENGLTRVEFEARSDNEPALRLYRKLGFQFEGTKKRGMRVDGEYKETTMMALLL